MTRMRILLLMFGIALLSLGTDPPPLHAAGSAPSVNVHRMTTFDGAVFTGDLNGDGIVDVVTHDIGPTSRRRSSQRSGKATAASTHRSAPASLRPCS
jgi:hypothetical protein